MYESLALESVVLNCKAKNRAAHPALLVRRRRPGTITMGCASGAIILSPAICVSLNYYSLHESVCFLVVFPLRGGYFHVYIMHFVFVARASCVVVGVYMENRVHVFVSSCDMMVVIAWPMCPIQCIYTIYKAAFVVLCSMALGFLLNNAH